MKGRLLWGWLLLIASQSFGQPADSLRSPWQSKAVGSLNLTQVTFDNWTQGGENAFSWQLLLDTQFAYQRERLSWTISGKFSFGKTRLGKSGFRKSVDEIRLESVLKFSAAPSLNPFFALTALTQFAPAYDYTAEGAPQISAFLDPGYFTQSLGLSLSPLAGFKARAGLAMKETITRNYPAPYADDPATPEVEKTRTEVGMDAVADLSRKLSKTILLTSKLQLFSNLKGIDEVDVFWDNLFSAQVAKHINVNWNFRLIYDKNVSKKRQINQSLAIGLTYTFL